MPIQSSDLLYKLSTTSGSAGNSVGQASPNLSLGKYISTTQITGATLNNLYDNISGDENAASTIDYRCFFIHNNHAGLPLQNAVAWISAEVAGGASVEIGLDPSGVFTVGSSTEQAVTIATELLAPNGVSFSAPTVKASGLSIGDITASGCQAIWVKRSAANTSAKNLDGFTVRIEGDSAE